MTARFLALGDSYTIGEGVAPTDRWPLLLAGRARSLGADLADPTIVARTGWTTDELSAALQAHPPDAPFDLVSLLVGVNDQYRGRPAVEYGQRFTDILRRAVAIAGGRARKVIVLSIPDWGVTPFAARDARGPAAISSDIDRFNAANREAAARAGAHYVDVTTVSRRAAADRSLLAADELHPSAAMYGDWVALVLPAALDALGVAERAGSASA